MQPFLQAPAAAARRGCFAGIRFCSACGESSGLAAATLQRISSVVCQQASRLVMAAAKGRARREAPSAPPEKKECNGKRRRCAPTQRRLRRLQGEQHAPVEGGAARRYDGPSAPRAKRVRRAAPSALPCKKCVMASEPVTGETNARPSSPAWRGRLDFLRRGRQPRLEFEDV